MTIPITPLAVSALCGQSYERSMIHGAMILRGRVQDALGCSTPVTTKLRTNARPVVRSVMPRFFQILVAVALLTSLGCSIAACSTHDDVVVDAHDDADAGPVLEPYAAELTACHGPNFESPRPSFHGQCCPQAHCYTPDDGKACASKDETAGLVEHPRGSGTCGCNVTREGFSGDLEVGPFSPNPSHTPKTSGTCCYVIGFIQCD
jgi:hypothetical protein